MTAAGGIPLWVPIVSAIGSPGVGALVCGIEGTFAAHRYALRPERKQQEREFEG